MHGVNSCWAVGLRCWAALLARQLRGSHGRMSGSSASKISIRARDCASITGLRANTFPRLFRRSITCCEISAPGDVHPIEPRLLDALSTLRGMLETEADFHVISGYRSPKTNEMLHERSAGVASTSLHMRGMAIDIRLSDRPLPRLREAALRLAAGGVGYYPKSNFVHIDVGRVRRW